MPPILTPTYDDGATTKASAMVYVPPDRQTSDAQLAERMPGYGLNMPFIADILSATLAHERCGRHLFRSVTTRSNNPVLQARYEEFGQAAERNVTMLEGVITAMGGDPRYVSPAARAVEGTDTKVLESTFLLSGSVDAMTQEMVLLDGVLIALSTSSANWSAMIEMAGTLPEGEVKHTITDGVAEAAPVCNQALLWGRETKAELVKLQASSKMMAAAGAKAEEMIQSIRGWLSS